MHACCPWRPEEGIGPLGLELQIVKSHCVGPGNQSQVLWNSEQLCSYPPSPLSSTVLRILCLRYRFFLRRLIFRSSFPIGGCHSPKISFGEQKLCAVHVCMYVCVCTHGCGCCVQHGCKCMCGGGGQRYMPNVFSVAFHCTFWVSFLLNLKLIDYLASRFQGPSCQVFSLSHRPLGCRLVRGAEDPDADVTSCSHRRCFTD